MNENKIVLSLLVIFTVVLSTGIAYAAVPFEGAVSSVSAFSGIVDSSLPGSYTLEDSAGGIWYLEIAAGHVLYGAVLPPDANETWPAYGFIFGNEMCLWADGPGTDEWVESLAYTGMWVSGRIIFNGTWVNYPYGNSGSVLMAQVMIDTSDEELENGQNPWIAPLGVASDTEAGGITPAGVKSVETVNAEPNPPSLLADISERVPICFEDSWEYFWDLDLAYEHVYYGTITSGNGTAPAYGFIFDDEMVLWENGAGGEYSDSFVYTGMWNSEMTTFDGTWVNYPFGRSGNVTLWLCLL